MTPPRCWPDGDLQGPGRGLLDGRPDRTAALEASPGRGERRRPVCDRGALRDPSPAGCAGLRPGPRCIRGHVLRAHHGAGMGDGVRGEELGLPPVCIRVGDRGMGRADPSSLVQAGLALGRFDSRGWIGSMDIPAAVVVTRATARYPPSGSGNWSRPSTAPRDSRSRPTIVAASTRWTCSCRRYSPRAGGAEGATTSPGRLPATPSSSEGLSRRFPHRARVGNS